MQNFPLRLHWALSLYGMGLLFAAAWLCLQNPVRASPPLGPPPPKPTKVADHSLSIEGYAKLGFPSLDLKWTEKDAAKAYSILAKLAKEDISKLPRYKSKSSGPVFAKLCQFYSESTASSFTLYNNRRWQFDNECAEFQLAWFRRTCRYRRQLSKRLKQLPPDAKERAELKKQRDGSVVLDYICFAQAVLFRSQYHWRAPARVSYYSGIEPTLREMISQMPIEFRSGGVTSEGIFAIIERDETLDPDPKVKAALRKLRADLANGKRQKARSR